MKSSGHILKIVSMVGLMAGCAYAENIAYEKTYQQAITSVKEGNLERAKACFSTALLYNPGDADAQRGLEMAEKRLSLQPPEVEYAEEKPKRFYLRIAGGTAPESEPSDDHPDLQVQLLVVRRPAFDEDTRMGFVWGAGLLLAGHAGKNYAYENENSSSGGGVGFIGQVGMAAKVGDHLTVEVVPYFGFGTMIISGYAQAGIKAGAHIPIGRQELGLEVGYGSFSGGHRIGPRPYNRRRSILLKSTVLCRLSSRRVFTSIPALVLSASIQRFKERIPPCAVIKRKKGLNGLRTAA